MGECKPQAGSMLVGECTYHCLLGNLTAHRLLLSSLSDGIKTV